MKFIEEGRHPDKQLAVLLDPHPTEAESALDSLYAMALNGAGKWDKDSTAVLGVVVTAREPLSDTTIDHILGLHGNRSSTFILSRLRCLLQWSHGQPVRILHASFADYLTDATRCGNQPWFISISFYHHFVSLSCFRIMKMELKFNICGLETSHVSNDEVLDLPIRIHKCIPNHLSYACRFWAEHLQRTDFQPDVLACLDKFLRRQLLYWLEVLSVIKAVHIASPALSSIVDRTQVSASVVCFKMEAKANDSG
jgi:hypothetical protein